MPTRNLSYLYLQFKTERHVSIPKHGVPLRLLPGLIRLLVTQGDHGVDFRGALRGDITGQQSDGEQHDGGSRKAERVDSAKAVEHVGDVAIREQGCGNSNGDADGDEDGDFAQDEAAYIGTGCPQGHADTDLIRAAADDVGHEAVDADGRQEDGQQSEEGRELGDEPLVGDGAGDLFVERCDISDGKVAVDGVDGLLDSG